MATSIDASHGRAAPGAGRLHVPCPKAGALTAERAATMTGANEKGRSLTGEITAEGRGLRGGGG
ncbi:MAG: hypothetical protein L6Q93_08465, partial [Phycisphaerae bacterium]|nr:hypothetical protein [Phycisphaerae bacterium]